MIRIPECCCVAALSDLNVGMLYEAIHARIVPLSNEIDAVELAILNGSPNSKYTVADMINGRATT